jgi:multidrug resistance efflux pump
MADFKHEAVHEVEQLSQELSRISARQRVIELKLAALNAYLAAEEADLTSRPRSPLAIGAVQRLMSVSQKKSVKHQVLETASRILSDDQPRTTEELVAALAQEGVAVGGANKALTVSSILSRDKNFKANRKHGWSLNKESLAENEAFNLQPTP